MSALPEALQATLSSGYSYGTPRNLFSTNTYGGTLEIVQDFRYGNTAFNVTIVTDRSGHALWADFFNITINQGADKFTMTLDSGEGAQTHTGQIQVGTVLVDGGSDPVWLISFVFVAEVLPRQD